ncbi:hypothetical protein ACH4HG_36235 [Streptomyces coeruleorubidus]|uniref:hypothetical protein n=1 Tax=Streptomyces coeruleorubidus TaxID=116188 RepID=UPI001874F676|nr:hypothetical protein [Streptomyces bellus]GGU21313.1 hypothetical protein GCM10010244_54820 [Streptomyces bellus]
MPLACCPATDDTFSAVSGYRSTDLTFGTGNADLHSYKLAARDRRARRTFGVRPASLQRGRPALGARSGGRAAAPGKRGDR